MPFKIFCYWVILFSVGVIIHDTSFPSADSYVFSILAALFIGTLKWGS
jgi:hypothetical protein